MFIGKRIRMRPKIVFMEAQSLGDDMELSMFDNLGDVTIYDVDDADKNAEHIKDADIAVMNKIKMDESILKDAKNLKLICITATGTDPIDVPYIKKRGIAASNVVGYSTEAVVQHTFSLLFYLWEKSRFYDDYVKRGEYERQVGFGCFPEKFHELAGKTWGIIGLGRIGRRVADIAKADLLIIMSDIDGLYDKDPHTYEDAKLIPVVHEITDEIKALAGGAGTKLGTGGMITKLNAVEIAYKSDIDVVLMNGQHPKTLYDLFDGKSVGTIFSKNED